MCETDGPVSLTFLDRLRRFTRAWRRTSRSGLPSHPGSPYPFIPQLENRDFFDPSHSWVLNPNYVPGSSGHLSQADNRQMRLQTTYGSTLCIPAFVRINQPPSASKKYHGKSGVTFTYWFCIVLM